MIAILEARRAGLLGRQHWAANIVSGVIVGVVALPLAMAFAIASGAKPEQGLYSAIIAGFVVSFLGGSRLQIGGPTGAFIVILAGITAKHGIDGLQIATLMAGLILLLLGIARLGDHHQVHSRSGDRRIYRRHRRHYLGRVSGKTSSGCRRFRHNTSTKRSGNSRRRCRTSNRLPPLLLCSRCCS